MQPKTRQQKRVMELYATIKPITSAQMEWGKNLYRTYAYFNKQTLICAYCGKDMGEELSCPHCKGKHQKVAVNNRKRESTHYFNVMQVVGEFQVLRTYMVNSVYQRRKEVNRCITEVCQSWLDSRGRETRVALAKVPMIGGWNINSLMEIRQKPNMYSSYYCYDMQEHCQSADIYPYTKQFIPILMRNGVKKLSYIRESGVHPVVFIEKIINFPMAETLLKAGKIKLLSQRGIEDVWQQVKITMRHHYEIKDWYIWYDTISLMRRFNMDVCNPKYICSDNIKELHDRLVERKRREEERERIKADMEKLLNNEKAKADYIKNKSAYFGICIVDNDLTIEVLKSIEEFIEEGAKMHHCVYSNGYYKLKSSLILSARINGERVETIEVSLRNFKILQSRGKYNQTTLHHNRIIRLMESNMDKIRNIRKKVVAIA